jgi:hypothetical protein
LPIVSTYLALSHLARSMKPDFDVGVWSSWLIHPVSLPGKKVHDDHHYSILAEMPPISHHCPKIE